MLVPGHLASTLSTALSRTLNWGTSVPFDAVIGSMGISARFFPQGFSRGHIRESSESRGKVL
jgi:hypothetical protein